MAVHVHRTLPSVFNHFFSFAHMLQPSVDIHHYAFPSPLPRLASQMRFKRRLNGIFYFWHDSLSLSAVFSAVAAERRSTRTVCFCSSDTLTQRLHLNRTLQLPVDRTHATTNGPVVLECVRTWVRWVTRQRYQALNPCDGAPGARQGCPAVSHWSPSISIFILCSAGAVKFNPLNGSLFVINLAETCPRGQIH